MSDPIAEYKLKRTRAISLGFFLCVLTIFAAIVALRLGAAKISMLEIVNIIKEKIFDTSNIQSGMSAVIWELRMPRIIASLLVGAGITSRIIFYIDII
ncbi:MAG: hypothetical protein Ta2F_05880 [Termitinemataceae bacterium]|nr:MAG: hypothetical protein Ta2F_05880 [Termitinemataceae bacterium]